MTFYAHVPNTLVAIYPYVLSTFCPFNLLSYILKSFNP